MKTFARGSLKIECTGDCERLLERCRKNGIALWAVNKTDGLTMTFFCNLTQFYKLAHICRKSGCRLHVLKKRGAPFLARKALRRPVLLLGLLALLVTLFIMSRCVWGVEIEVDEGIKENEVRVLLAEAGLKMGVLKRSVRAQDIKNHVISSSDKIVYLTVNIKGSTAFVHAYLRLPIPPKDGKEPCDLVSDLSGIVTAQRIEQGTPLVRTGQAIFEGDLIASSEVVDKNGEIRYYHADGEIDVRTLYTRKCLLPKEVYKLTPTGKTKTKRYLIVAGKTVKLYMIETVSYKWYYKSVERQDLYLGDTLLPATLVTETYTECTREPYTLEKQEAQSLLSGRMLSSFARLRPQASIINESFNIVEDTNAFCGILRLECSETTGIKVPR